MLNKNEIIQTAKQVLHTEAKGIKSIISTINENFVKAVELILTTKGRVIVTGIGKPGYIAHKLSATLMSTGTPSFYLHPAEAIHGDLGSITKDDIIIAISNSGETSEIVNILPTIKLIGAPLISICGNASSTLAQFASCHLNAQVQQEACPHNLAPTTSTTVQLALGDALAITIMQAKGFTDKDFAFYHPGGNLGKIRLKTVKNLVKMQNRKAFITSEKNIYNAIFVMTDSGIGAVGVIDKNNILLGIITDGDIRRQLKVYPDLLNKNVKEIMITNPTTINENQYVSEAILVMEHHKPRPITVLPVIDDKNHFLGMMHITDIHH
ncbi:arabinose-5-phosphate isomerase [Gilliamella bombicola]|uniref:Arabinose 5-phosphate isomerase n=1 Tax=Gilliamella bombicola TaxID=1798182 RepID=A0A1C4CPJ8_9GAMM|nr:MULTISPECIES: KpsF/GutQ family sugar-phosphate isomerase [Gilliamella]NUF26796.1 KpsF/GutQ family sugar-phosphate isomerase [Gilliamella sp. ESL0254]SCC20974.1 arabinose-5-phosphate isomerase [Gilliamella bombicola]